MKAIVSGAVYLPKSAINVEEVKHHLTVAQWTMGAKEATHVFAFEEYDKYLAVPRDYGLKSIAKLRLDTIDEMSDGVAVRFPKVVTHTGDYSYQGPFVDEILRCCEEYNDFLVEAATGKGKTVCALSVAQKRGRNTLVVVDQDNLMQQWRKECKKALGLKDSQIGTVQGGVCDYKGKLVTIAMIQSLTRRDYPEEFYDHFGTVIFDEFHTTGAPTFSKALLMFSARVRFGISATDRRDALQRILRWNLGETEVELKDAHERSFLYYIESDTVYSWYANISPKTGRILTEVSEDAVRNLRLVEAIQWLYDSGRDVLVIGDRIEQLENLKSMCYYSGIPEEDLGLYCGFRNKWLFEKDPKPKRRPYGYVKGTEYTPVKFGRVRKRIPKKELEEIKETAKVIFATFGMFSKGVDVPRLSGGVDCTPRSKAQQTHGRILRAVDNKYIPIWVTVRDINSYRLDYQFLQRIDEYQSSSAEIYQWQPDKGVRSRDVMDLKREVHQNIKELRQLNIITCVDGRNMLTTPPTPTEQKSPPAKRTGRNTR